MSIVWEEAPARSRNGGRTSKWIKILEDVKAKPGEQARVFVGTDKQAAATAAMLRKKSPDFEIISRRLNNEQHGVWVKYIGETT